MDRDEAGGRNPDGTWNGAKVLSNLSGLSEQEITWMFNRIKELKSIGKSKAEQIEILSQEGKSKPWCSPPERTKNEKNHT